MASPLRSIRTQQTWFPKEELLTAQTIRQGSNLEAYKLKISLICKIFKKIKSLRKVPKKVAQNRKTISKIRMKILSLSKLTMRVKCPQRMTTIRVSLQIV